MHLDYAAYNFGIHEGENFSDQLKELFPGAPEIRKAIRYSNGLPGLGVDIDEKVAAKYPLTSVGNNRSGPRFRRRAEAALILFRSEQSHHRAAARTGAAPRVSRRRGAISAGGAETRLRSLGLGRGEAGKGAVERVPVERAFPARDDDRRHRIADEIGQRAAFRHEPVDAEDQRQPGHRHGRHDRERGGKRDEAGPGNPRGAPSS